MIIGQKIKDLRKELNMSVDELAAKLGKNRATIYRYEKGDIGNLPIDILEPLAKALETTPAYLMGWDDRKDKDTLTVGELLKMMRTQRHMSIEEFSKEIGITAEDLGKYETGEKYIPLKVINMIAEYYRLSLESFTKEKKNGENNIRLERLESWVEEFGDIEFTEEEHNKIVEYCKFLLYTREK